MSRQPITKIELLSPRDRRIVDDRLAKVRGIFGNGAKFVSHTPDDDPDPDWKQRIIAERFTFSDEEVAKEEKFENEEEPEQKATVELLELQGAALYGLPGDIVKTVLPHTEAHPAALLTHTLLSYGNIIGHNAHFRVEHTPHHLNLFSVLVGATSRSRKGTSGSTLGHTFQQIDPDWHKKRIKSGLSSGQGLIWAVRDPITESRQNKEGEDEERVVDPGEGDKRLLVIEQEFSQALKSMPLEGNILSAVIREAWDSGNLNTLTSGRKLKPVTASDAHISILGHITKEEPIRHLNTTEQSNGFANRFLWLSIERSKRISNPKGTPDSLLLPLIDRLRDAVAFGTKTAEINRDKDAEDIGPHVIQGSPTTCRA